MGLRNDGQRYGSIALLLHWSAAFCVLFAWILGTLIDAPNIACTAESSTACTRSWPRIGPRRTSKPKAPPKSAWKISSTDPKPAPGGGKPPERRPS